MKSPVKSISLAIAISFLSLTACEKNNISDENKLSENPRTLADYLGKKIQKNFIGTVVSEEEKPLENVAITIGNKTILTDSNGDFIIENANVNTDFAYLEAKKEGYKNNALSIVPSNSINEVIIELQEENELCLYWFCKHNHSLPNSNK